MKNIILMGAGQGLQIKQKLDMMKDKWQNNKSHHKMK